MKSSALLLIGSVFLASAASSAYAVSSPEPIEALEVEMGARLMLGQVVEKHLLPAAEQRFYAVMKRVLSRTPSSAQASDVELIGMTCEANGRERVCRIQVDFTGEIREESSDHSLLIEVKMVHTGTILAAQALLMGE